jgi:hypothetical protein
VAHDLSPAPSIHRVGDEIRHRGEAATVLGAPWGGPAGPAGRPSAPPAHQPAEAYGTWSPDSAALPHEKRQMDYDWRTGYQTSSPPNPVSGSNSSP